MPKTHSLHVYNLKSLSSLWTAPLNNLPFTGTLRFQKSQSRNHFISVLHFILSFYPPTAFILHLDAHSQHCHHFLSTRRRHAFNFQLHQFLLAPWMMCHLQFSSLLSLFFFIQLHLFFQFRCTSWCDHFFFYSPKHVPLKHELGMKLELIKPLPSPFLLVDGRSLGPPLLT